MKKKPRKPRNPVIRELIEKPKRAAGRHKRKEPQEMIDHSESPAN